MGYRLCPLGSTSDMKILRVFLDTVYEKTKVQIAERVENEDI